MRSFPERWLPWLRVALVPVTVAVASALQMAATSPVISDRPYMLLFAAVLAPGWFRGIGPSLLAAVLAAAVGFFYLYPASGGTAPYLSLSMFLGFSSALAAALDSWRRALHRASAALEQLRVLWHGYRIAVTVSADDVPPGVDTPQDLETVRALFDRARESG